MLNWFEVSKVRLSVIAVAPDEELWAVTPIGGLSRRLTKLLPKTVSRPAPSGPAPGGEDGDEEWELL